MFISYECARPHSKECWERVAEILEESEDGQATLARAEARMDQDHRIIADNVAPSGADVLAPPPPAPWPAAHGVEGAESDADEVEQHSLRCIEAFIDAARARYISCKLGGKFTKEGIRQVFEKLNAKFTARRTHAGRRQRAQRQPMTSVKFTPSKSDRSS